MWEEVTVNSEFEGEGHIHGIRRQEVHPGRAISFRKRRAPRVEPWINATLKN